VVRKWATETEHDCRVCAEMITAIRQAESFRLLDAFGGNEYNSVGPVAVSNGLSAWLYSLGSVHRWMVGCLPEEVQHAAWHADRKPILAVSCPPSETAAPVGRHYRMSTGIRIEPACVRSSQSCSCRRPSIQGAMQFLPPAVQAWHCAIRHGDSGVTLAQLRPAAAATTTRSD
jgi:hypothetical protein